jgi:hypothetical protein
MIKRLKVIDIKSWFAMQINVGLLRVIAVVGGIGLIALQNVNAATSDQSVSPAPKSATTAYIGSPPQPEAIPPLPTDAESQHLIQRVEARWHALVEHEFDGAYTYEEPAFKEANTVDQYRGKFGHQVKWHNARVVRLEIIEDNRAKVGVAIDRSFIDPVNDQLIRGEAFIWEHWIKIGGEWWRQSRWSSMPGKVVGDSD